MKMLHAIALSCAVLLNACANLLMKFGVRTLSLPKLKFSADSCLELVKIMFKSPLILIGLSCFALNVIFYTYALQKFKVSLAYPIMVGCGFVIIVVIARFSGLNERLTAGQWLGAGLIFAGVLLISTSMQN